MRRIILTLIVVIFATSAFAYTEPSLRMKAMGKSLAGIVEDQQTDIYLNPARMALIEKSQVYGMFEPRGTYYEYPIDLPLPVPYKISQLRLNAAYLWKLNQRNSLGVAVDVNHGSRSSESEESERGGRLDPYHNYYTTEYREKKSENESTSQDITARLMYARELSNEWNLGIGYIIEMPDQTSESQSESHEETEYYNYHAETFYGEFRDEEQENRYENQENIHYVDLGVLRNTDMCDWDFKLTVKKSDRESAFNYLSSRNRYRVNEETDTYYKAEDEALTEDGWGIRLAARMRRQASKNRSWIFMGTLGMDNADIDGETVNHGKSNRIFENDTLHLYGEFDEEEKSASEISGDYTEYNAKIGIGQEIRLKKHTTIGFGLIVVMNQHERNLDKLGDYYYKKTTEDSTEEVSEGFTGYEEEKRTDYFISFPIGADVYLGKGFYVRGGITPQYTLQTTEIEERLTPYHEHSEISSDRDESEMQTDTTLGIGYDYDDKFIVDVLMSSDLDQYKNWECSIKYTF
jgi:hypothetical protein